MLVNVIDKEVSMLYSVTITCDIIETVEASSLVEAQLRAIEVMDSKMKYTVLKVKAVSVEKK